MRFGTRLGAALVGLAFVGVGLAACSGTTSGTDGAADANDAIAADTSDAAQPDVASDTHSIDVVTVDAPDVTSMDVSDVTAPDVSDASTVRVPMFHRADDSACSAPAPAGNCTFGGGTGMCSADTDCTTGTNGRCVMSNGGAVICRCSYDTCTHDTDCPTAQLCACHGGAYTNGGNSCIAGNCRVDSDCGANGYCSPSRAIGGCGGLGGYYCHTAMDTCINDGDCPSGGGPQGCSYSPTTSRWACTGLLLCP